MKWLHARLEANEEAGWEYVAESHMEPTLADRAWFFWLKVENALLRAAVKGGSLTWM